MLMLSDSVFQFTWRTVSFLAFTGRVTSTLIFAFPLAFVLLPTSLTTLANAFEWLLKNNYQIQDLMHDLDNYFTVSHANYVETITRMASQVAIPLAPNKLEGSTTRLVFLGILIGMTSMKCRKRELLSLIGKLNFACWIIFAGHISYFSTSPS